MKVGHAGSISGLWLGNNRRWRYVDVDVVDKRGLAAVKVYKV